MFHTPYVFYSIQCCKVNPYIMYSQRRQAVGACWGGGGGGGGVDVGSGLNRFHATATLALDSAVVHKHTSCSVRVKDFYSSMNQISKHINQDITLR